MRSFSLIAFRNVIKNWRHSLAATISISAGFVSLVLFQGYIIDVENMYKVGFRNRAMYGDLLVEHPELQTKEGRSDPEKFYIKEDQQAEIFKFLDGRSEKIKARVRFLPATGIVSNGKNSTIFYALGFDVEQGQIARGDVWRWDALFGKPLHLANDPQGALIGKSLGYLLGCLPVNPKTDLVQNGGYKAEERPFQCERNSIQLTATTETGQVNAFDLNVVGLNDGGYKDIDEKWIKLSIENVQALLNTKNVKFMSILLNDGEDVIGFRDDLNRYLKNKGVPQVAQRWIDHPVADLFIQTMSLLNIFKSFIVVVIMTISGLSVFNTMVKIVKERTKEIGTLRSLGFTGGQVGSIFTFEAFYLSLVGICIGMVFSLLFTLWINNSGIVYKAGLLSTPVLFKIVVDPNTYLASLILLSVLAVFTSWISTRHIVKSHIAENLTYA